MKAAPLKNTDWIIWSVCVVPHVVVVLVQFSRETGKHFVPYSFGVISVRSPCGVRTFDSVLQFML